MQDWSKPAMGERLTLPFETRVPPVGKSISWELNLYPKGLEHDQERLFRVSLVVDEYDLEPDERADLFTKDKFQIETAYRIRKGDTCKPLDMSNSRSYLSFHSNVFIGQAYKCQWLGESYKAYEEDWRAVDGIFTFDFEMKTYSAPWMKFQYSGAKLEMFSKFSEVPGETCDVKLICSDETIPCHKFVLVSQSPVFRAMFGTDSKESQENVVNIVDSNPEALRSFVRYLQTGNFLPDPSFSDLDLIFGVLNLANKYQVQLLVDGCIDALMDAMDEYNVLKIMAVVDKLDVGDHVTKMVIDFMKENIRVVVENEDWAAFLCDHPTLVKDLILHMNEEMLFGSKN